METTVRTNPLENFPIHTVAALVTIGIVLCASVGLIVLFILVWKLHLRKIKREKISSANPTYCEIAGPIYETIKEAAEEMLVKMAHNDAYEEIHLTPIQMESNDSYQEVTVASINSPITTTSEALRNTQLHDCCELERSPVSPLDNTQQMCSCWNKYASQEDIKQVRHDAIQKKKSCEKSSSSLQYCDQSCGVASSQRSSITTVSSGF